MANDVMQVPDQAVYLGTPMGGDFVVLERHNLQIEGGRTLPAFRMQIFGATSSGGPYGSERTGHLVFDGYGLYVPPETETGTASPGTAEPPPISEFLSEAWVNNAVVHWRTQPFSVDPEGKSIALIVPLHFPQP